MTSNEAVVICFKVVHQYFPWGTKEWGARGSLVGWRTMLQAGKSPVRVPDEVDFFQFT
jgi:hypothetical protein